MPTRHRVHVAEAQFQWTPSTIKYDRQIADWIDSIAATRRTALSFAATRKTALSFAVTRRTVFSLAATRRK